jgi:hypothetical protein
MSDSVYDPRCKEIQHHDGVRFAAIINHAGEKIAGGFTEGVNPYEAFQHTGLAVVLQGLVRPRLRGTELEFWRNSEEARTDRPSQQLRSLNGEWRLMRYFLLTHLCGISHRIWCTLSTICSDAA